jgi:hypothetical protein
MANETATRQWQTLGAPTSGRSIAAPSPRERAFSASEKGKSVMSSRAHAPWTDAGLKSARREDSRVDCYNGWRTIAGLAESD